MNTPFRSLVALRFPVFMALIGFLPGVPFAASFDCAKATTQIEKSICVEPGLSRLDGELGHLYESARHTAPDPASLKAEQVRWLEERNRCEDEGCLRKSYESRIAQLRAGTATTSTKEAGVVAPRYRLVAGMGYSVCEAYLKHLNAFPPDAPPMICNVRPNPKFSDITQPKWEELSVEDNLSLIYAAELLLPPYYKWQYKYREPPKPFPSYEEWKAGFDARVKAGKISPRLYRTRLALNERGPETLIGYEPEPDLCEHNLHKYNSATGDGPHIFVLNDDPEEPLKHIGVGSDLRASVLMSKGRPFFAWGASHNPKTWTLELYAVFSKMRSDVPKEYGLGPRCEYRFSK
jgi:uncharacterized protein YecT (DUF1311 family)